MKKRGDIVSPSLLLKGVCRSGKKECFRAYTSQEISCELGKRRRTNKAKDLPKALV